MARCFVLSCYRIDLSSPRTWCSRFSPTLQWVVVYQRGGQVDVHEAVSRAEGFRLTWPNIRRSAPFCRLGNIQQPLRMVAGRVFHCFTCSSNDESWKTGRWLMLVKVEVRLLRWGNGALCCDRHVWLTTTGWIDPLVPMPIRHCPPLALTRDDPLLNESIPGVEARRIVSFSFRAFPSSPCWLHGISHASDSCWTQQSFPVAFDNAFSGLVLLNWHGQ